MMQTIRVKLLHPTAQIPTRGRGGDAGWDLYAYGARYPGDGSCVISTGIAVEIPPGYFGLVLPRSGLGFDGWTMHPGVIDSNYRGEVKLMVHHLPPYHELIEGERVAQLLILPVPDTQVEVVETLTPTDRGDAGFGSSGR